MITLSQFKQTQYIVKSASAELDFEFCSTSLYPTSNKFTFLNSNTGYISILRKDNYTFDKFQKDIPFEAITSLKKIFYI